MDKTAIAVPAGKFCQILGRARWANRRRGLKPAGGVPVGAKPANWYAPQQ